MKPDIRWSLVFPVAPNRIKERMRINHVYAANKKPVQIPAHVVFCECIRGFWKTANTETFVAVPGFSVVASGVGTALRHAGMFSHNCLAVFWRDETPDNILRGYVKMLQIADVRAFFGVTCKRDSVRFAPVVKLLVVSSGKTLVNYAVVNHARFSSGCLCIICGAHVCLRARLGSDVFCCVPSVASDSAFAARFWLAPLCPLIPSRLEQKPYIFRFPTGGKKLFINAVTPRN